MKCPEDSRLGSAGALDAASGARSEPALGVGVFGRGRLGSALAETIVESPDCRLQWHVGRGEAPSANALCAIDASLPEAVESHLEWALATRSDLVIAVTGWRPASSAGPEEDWQGLAARVKDRIGVVVAPNGSLTMALLQRLSRILGAFSRSIPGAEGYLFDHHHAQKKDAPSGTALRLAEAWSSGSGAQIPIASLRAGHEIGLHTLGFDAPEESVEIRHRARSRVLFARGLLTAARWVRGRRGLFSMEDVAASVLDPLFCATSPSRAEPQLLDTATSRYRNFSIPQLLDTANSGDPIVSNFRPAGPMTAYPTPTQVSSTNPAAPREAGEHPFRGLWVALATPFDADGEIDLWAFRRLIRHCLHPAPCAASAPTASSQGGPGASAGGGVEGLLVLGSTGEAATLDDNERDRLVAACLEEAGSVPVMVGTGSNDTRRAVALTRRAQELGASGALVVSPWYNKPNPAGMQAHFVRIAEAVDLPLVAYNVPGRTGCNLDPEAVAELWQIPSLLAIKESSGDLAQIDSILRSAPEGRIVLAGDDALALPSIALGAGGLVSVVANLLPAEARALVEDALESRFESARQRHARLLPLVEALFVESNPVPLKAGLALLGLAGDRVRAPLAEASSTTRQHLRSILAQLEEVAA